MLTEKELDVPLRVSNLVMSGKIPLDHKLDFGDFISRLDGWFVVNEELSPIVQKRYERQDGTRPRRHHYRRRCSVTVSIWPSGAINIVGLRSVEEGEETRDKVLLELQLAGIL